MARMVSIRMKIMLILVGICLLAMPIVAVLGEGTIRINPALPIMVGTKYTFLVWTQCGTAYEPSIFLVMTNACHDSLTNVIIEWVSGSITLYPEDFTIETEHTGGIKVPPNANPGYTVASLMDHLGTIEPIWWAFKSFLDGPITNMATSFTLTLNSENPRMLVYVLGKRTTSATTYTLFVPPTIPGFIIPEPATMASVAISMFALATYVTLRKRK